MKPSIVASAIFLVVAVGQASAACTDPQVTDSTVPNLQTVLEGHTVCTTRTVTVGTGTRTDKYQEEHHSGDVVNGAPLWDYKLGDGDPMDPRKQVGTWAIVGTGPGTQVEYSYGAGTPLPGDPAGPYRFSVHHAAGGGTAYTFCGESNTSEVLNATVIPSGSGCP